MLGLVNAISMMAVMEGLHKRRCDTTRELFASLPILYQLRLSGAQSIKDRTSNYYSVPSRISVTFLRLLMLILLWAGQILFCWSRFEVKEKSFTL